MTIEELLTEIGLTDKEAHMYITLLRHGNQPTSYLAKKSGFNRGTAYVILHQLLEKGLAAKSMKKKVQCFTPLDPSSLIDYLDRKSKLAESGKQKVATMMGQLTAITNPHTAKPKIEFFDGSEGARTVLERTLQAKERTITAFQSISDILEFVGADYFSDYAKKRKKAGFTLHAIRTKEQDKQALNAVQKPTGAKSNILKGWPVTCSRKLDMSRFGGVPITVVKPPKAEPNAIGIKTIEGERLALIAV